ncbi:hypothetical protein C1646_13847 [Rhizophagus diaphanus]|nr:hypothetical protein C1646_13847 [Rhizophagus diaphanus] [Rhizophagus sp. MUCL 43196]
MNFHIYPPVFFLHTARPHILHFAPIKFRKKILYKPEMSITLLYSHQRNTTANAFAVDIDRKKLVSHHKEAIKAKKAPEFVQTSSKLCKVEIAGYHND